MADITKLLRLTTGIDRSVDLTTNTLVTLSVKFGGSISPTELTKAILDNLVALQNGADFSDGTNSHTHDGRYYTETELGSTTNGSSGADKIGVSGTPSNFTPTSQDVQGFFEGVDSALVVAGGSDFLDSEFRISDNILNTKKMAFEVSAISNDTTRTVTMPDADVNLGALTNANISASAAIDYSKLAALTINRALVSDASGFVVVSAVTATELGYVSGVTSSIQTQLDNLSALIDGRTWKNAARAMSDVNIDLAVAADPNPVDGVTLVNNDRVVLNGQTAPEENGIYVAVDAEDPTTWVRSSDANTSAELEGAAISILEGSSYAGSQWYQSQVDITVGTDPVTFVYLGSNNIFGHDMITVVGTQISVDLAAVSGLESTNPGNANGQLRVKLEGSNPSLQINGSNELGAKLDAAGAILSGASGLAVQVDNSGIEINTNALRLKDAGTTAAKLNTNVADQLTITGGAGTALAVAKAPKVGDSYIAGESFAANTSFLVRWALTGETAGRVYKADKDATSVNKYAAFGIALSPAGAVAGDPLIVTTLGTHALGSSDTPFNAADVGKELFVGTTGAFILGAALADTTGEAAFCVGTIRSTTSIWFDFKQLRGIA